MKPSVLIYRISSFITEGVSGYVILPSCKVKKSNHFSFAKSVGRDQMSRIAPSGRNYTVCQCLFWDIKRKRVKLNIDMFLR